MSEVRFKTVAWGIVDASAGFLTFGRGCTLTRNGVGDFEINLSDGFELDDSEMMIDLTPINTAGHVVFVLPSTDTAKGVNTFDTGGLAADIDFFFEIRRLIIA